MRWRVLTQGFATLLVHPYDDSLRCHRGGRRGIRRQWGGLDAVTWQPANDFNVIHLREPFKKRIAGQRHDAGQRSEADQVSLLAAHNRGRGPVASAGSSADCGTGSFSTKLIRVLTR